MGRSFSRLIAAFLSSTALIVGSASAQDAASAWSGFYGGVHAGMGHSGTATATGFIEGFSLSEGFPIDTGILGGVQLGYNFHNDRVVYGLEVDFSGADLSSAPGALFDLGIVGELGTFTTQVDWFGTVRARVGVLLSDDFLFYGTGGLAYGNVESSIGYRLGPCPFCLEDSVSGSEVRVGWTAGAGVEAGISDSMRVKLEYLYVDLGSDEFFRDTIPVPFTNGVDVGASSDVNFHVARVGLNIDFDMPIPGQ